MAVAKDYAAITSIEQLKRLVDQMLAEGRPIGFDLETGYTGKDFRKRSLDHYNEHQFVVGFSFSNDPSWARYVPMRHDSGGNIDDVDAVWDVMRPMLESGHIISFHQKFERAAVWKAAGIDLGKSGRVDDPMLAAYVLGEYYNKSWRTIVGLKELVKEIYEHDMMHIHDLWPDLPMNKYDFIRFNTLEVTPEVISYACEDAAWVLPLHKDLCLAAEIDNPFMYTLEHKVANMMVEVERYGVSVDWEGIEQAYAQAQTFVPQMEAHVKQELGKLAGRDVSSMNLNSAQQKQRLLFDEVGLTTTAVSKITGKMSASKKSLVGLAKEYPAIQDLLDYGEVQNLSRRLKKWLTDYTEATDRRVHASYNQVTVPSGRFATGEPAIQQLPTFPWLWIADDIDFDPEEDKDELEAYKESHDNGTQYWAGKFRNFIVAAPDHYLLTFDFSQAELRVLTGASQEPTLLEAYANGEDIHTATASMMFGVPVDQVDKEMRKRGKTINFAILYGQGVKALGEQLGIEIEEAKELYAQYFASLPYVTAWYNEAKRKGFRNGFTKTLLGRKVPIWELLSDQKSIKSKGERVIINSEIQGGVADYVKFVQLQARKALIDKGLWNNGVMMTMNQHDSLTFECHNSLDPNMLRDLLQPVVVLEPENFPPLKGYPPFVADWEIGQLWGASKGWDLERKAVFDGEHWVVEPETALDKVVITVDEMPTESVWTKLIATLKENPGKTEVEFVCPQGTVELFPSDLTVTRIGDLKKILVSARIEEQ